MPHLEINGTRIFYTDAGAGEQTIVFSHGLLFSTEMWEAQIAHFAPRYRCIAYDHRGQGQSAAPADGYDMDSLTEDAAALIRALDVAPVHFAGLSMGGFVAQRLAVRHPDLLKSAIILDSSADAEPAENLPGYRQLNFILRWFGGRPIAGKLMPIMFGQSFLNDPARAAERKRWKAFLSRTPDRRGMSRAIKGVLERDDFLSELGRISLPVLIAVGEEDMATVPEKSERLHAAIPGSKLVRMRGAGHVSTIDAPDRVNAAMEAFLSSLS